MPGEYEDVYDCYQERRKRLWLTPRKPLPSVEPVTVILFPVILFGVLLIGVGVMAGWLIWGVR